MRRPRARVRAALLALTACLPACGGSGPAPADAGALVFPDAPVLLISLDTLRADRLGCYGYERGTSPVLDAFADESVLFEQAYATSCKTAESHMSLFTSLPVSAHGVSNASARLGLTVRALPKSVLMLGQVLRRAGYWNSAVACGGNLDPRMGFARGFEGRFESVLRDVSAIVDRTLQEWDAAARQERPAFVFMHTYQVHGPYLPPEPYLSKLASDLGGVIGKRVAALRGVSFQEAGLSVGSGFWDGEESFGDEDTAALSDLYDGEIGYTDEHLGRLFDGLRERGVLDRMIVVIFSDHGEEFREHGSYQHDQLFTETLHVPLIVRLPDGRLGGTRVKGITSLLDVMPTLLELLGLEGPASMTGRSLVPAMQAGRIADRPAFAERTMFPDDYLSATRTATESAHFSPARGTIEVYDLQADPGEMERLPADGKRAAGIIGLLYDQLAGVFALRAELDATDPGETFTLDEQKLQELKELNYLGGESSAVPAGTPLDAWPQDLLPDAERATQTAPNPKSTPESKSEPAQGEAPAQAPSGPR